MRDQLLTIFFLRDEDNNEEEFKIDSEEEVDVGNEKYDDENPAQLEYETDPQIIHTTGDAEAVEDYVDQEGEVLDVGEVRQGTETLEKLVVDLMARNSEDGEIGISQMTRMEGPGVAASEPLTDNVVSFPI